MKLQNQALAIDKLKDCAERDIHSIAISGGVGYGKTFLASQYASFLGIKNFHIVEPKVADIRDLLNNTAEVSERMVVCIENLDTGVLASAYALLKFIEEPMPNIYIVVTYRNRESVPDTILSRCSIVSIGNPSKEDLLAYVKHRYPNDSLDIIRSDLYEMIASYSDIVKLATLSEEQKFYISNIYKSINFNYSVDKIVWGVTHFADNTQTPVTLVLLSLLRYTPNRHNRKLIIDSIDEISKGRIAQHAILSKLFLSLKYAM